MSKGKTPFVVDCIFPVTRKSLRIESMSASQAVLRAQAQCKAMLTKPTDYVAIQNGVTLLRASHDDVELLRKTVNRVTQ